MISIISNTASALVTLACETKLITTLDDLANNLNSGLQADLVLLDFKKLLKRFLTTTFMLQTLLL